MNCTNVCRGPLWAWVLLIGCLIPQVAWAGIPRPQRSIPLPKGHWVDGSKRTETPTLPLGLLLDTQLMRNDKKNFPWLAQRGEIAQIDREIYRLRLERNRRFSIVGPIIMIGIGATLLLPGVIIGFVGLLSFLATGTAASAFLVLLLAGLFLVPGSILLSIGLATLGRRARSRRRYDRRIRRLQRKRRMLMTGADRDPGPPPPGTERSGEPMMSMPTPHFQFQF